MSNPDPLVVMSLRLDKEQAEQLRLVAEADGMPASQAVREAITEYIERRRGDREFQVRLKASIERNNEVLTSSRLEEVRPGPPAPTPPEMAGMGSSPARLQRTTFRRGRLL